MKNILLALAVLGFANFASASTDAKYYQLGAPEVKMISHEVLAPLSLIEDFPDLAEETPKDPVDEFELKLDQIVNIGKKIWAIIELGRPVVDVRTDVATALPEGVTSWQTLSQWSAPESRTYEVTFRNGYKVPVVSFKYRVIYIYGGGHEGVGRYIGYATIVPVNIHVQYGFNLRAEATIPSVFNVGTRSNPVGGMHLTMKYSIKTVMSHVEQSQAYFVDGTGQFKKLD